MNGTQNLFEPVIDFREARQQMQIETERHHELYEKAFFPGEETSHSDYALNTTTWD